MGSKKPFQRKQNRINKKTSRLAKNRLKISFQGAHALVGEHWDKKKTLLENYKEMGEWGTSYQLYLCMRLDHPNIGASFNHHLHYRASFNHHLGLLSHLNGHAGGKEKDSKKVALEMEAIQRERAKSVVVEWKTIQQADQEKLEKEEAEKEQESHPWLANGPLEEEVEIQQNVVTLGCKISTHSDAITLKTTMQLQQDHFASAKGKSIISQMEQESKNILITPPRHLSHQEMIVFKRLVAKYGQDDFDRMARDRKLNPYQLSAGQLKAKFTRNIKDN